jgi:hypothetical protein
MHFYVVYRTQLSMICFFNTKSGNEILSIFPSSTLQLQKLIIAVRTVWVEPVFGFKPSVYFPVFSPRSISIDIVQHDFGCDMSIITYQTETLKRKII